jgi:threonine aldolase
MATASVIDLRSDTVTRPTPGMRQAMANAEVGDDVQGEDPTVNRLQQRLAEYLGKEAALFVPTGTMSNQCCIRAHTQPGDEILCEATNHIHIWEAGGPAALWGVTVNPIPGDSGVLDLADLSDKIKPPNDHYVRTRLVSLENTHNRGGGRVYPLEKVKAISRWARANGLAMHLDGARLWNAVVASGVPAREWASEFDSVSVCFSKGLGAPVGSALAGTKEFVARCKRVRKLLGGGMRQAGIIAAGALYALENHVERLVEDHRKAQVLAEVIRDTPGLRLDPATVETNIVWFAVGPELGTSKDFAATLREQGVLVNNSYGQLRAVTHLDVSAAQVERAAELIRATARRPVRAG